MSEDKKEGSSVYTEAKDCVKEGNTDYTIEVKRAVRDVDEKKSVESTVITEEIQRKKENTSVFDYTGTYHDVSGGTSTEHVARETTKISRRNGTPKVIIEEKEKTKLTKTLMAVNPYQVDKTAQYLGQHVLAEFFECDPNILNNPQKVESLMIDAALECGATIVNKCFHLFAPSISAAS